MNLAVIPAAGKGTRLGKVGAALPKPLVPVAGRPVIDHIFEMLKKAGMSRVILIVGYKKEQILSYVGDGSDFGMSVSYVVQENPRGLASAVLTVKPFVKEDFLCVLGDTLLFPMDSLRELVKLHSKKKPSASVLVKRIDDVSQYGIISPRGDRVVGVVEKPKPGRAPSNLALVGAYVFSPEIFRAVEKVSPNPRTGELELTDAIQKLIAEGRTIVYREFDGAYLDVGKIESIRSVDRALRGLGGGARPRKVEISAMKSAEPKAVVEFFKGPSIESSATLLKPGASTTGHRHFDAEEVYVFLGGEGVMEVNKSRWKVKPGDVVSIGLGDFHRVVNTGRGMLRFIAVYPSGLRKEYGRVLKVSRG